MGRKKTLFKINSITQVYILDEFPNARFGFSLRKLSSSSTVAIRVRRSSDNAEQDIGFDGDDLDTNALITFVGAGDGFVTIWYNQGPLGGNFVQTTIGSEPKVMTGGALELNSLFLPTISFATGNMTNSTFSCQSNHTSIIVAEWASSNQPTLRGIGSSGYNWCFRRFANGGMWFRMNGSQAQFTSVIHSNNTTWLAVFTRNDPANTMQLVSNGTDLGTQPQGRSGNWVNAELGYQNADINEIIVFDGHQPTEIPAMSINANSYYGIY